VEKFAAKESSEINFPATAKTSFASHVDGKFLSSTTKMTTSSLTGAKSNFTLNCIPLNPCQPFSSVREIVWLEMQFPKNSSSKDLQDFLGAQQAGWVDEGGEIMHVNYAASFIVEGRTTLYATWNEETLIRFSCN
jgi:hypothetical protein